MLVDELLDMARLRAIRVKLNLGPINLPDLITEVVAQAQPVLEERAQVIQLDLPGRDSHRWNQLWILGDRRRLEQVLLNLLANANKYGPQGSRITVGTTARDGSVRVFVRDEGPGVPRGEEARIFEKYYQVSYAEGARDNRSHGLGLGLAIARAIVEMHGGSIGVTTSAGKGSTFHFSLPLYDCHEQGAELGAAGNLHDGAESSAR
jgi:signal transduction histidine kinase